MIVRDRLASSAESRPQHPLDAEAEAAVARTMQDALTARSLRRELEVYHEQASISTLESRVEQASRSEEQLSLQLESEVEAACRKKSRAEDECTTLEAELSTANRELGELRQQSTLEAEVAVARQEVLSTRAECTELRSAVKSHIYSVCRSKRDSLMKEVSEAMQRGYDEGRAMSRPSAGPVEPGAKEARATEADAAAAEDRRDRSRERRRDRSRSRDRDRKKKEKDREIAAAAAAAKKDKEAMQEAAQQAQRTERLAEEFSRCKAASSEELTIARDAVDAMRVELKAAEDSARKEVEARETAFLRADEAAANERAHEEYRQLLRMGLRAGWLDPRVRKCESKLRTWLQSASAKAACSKVRQDLQRAMREDMQEDTRKAERAKDLKEELRLEAVESEESALSLERERQRLDEEICKAQSAAELEVELRQRLQEEVSDMNFHLELEAAAWRRQRSELQSELEEEESQRRSRRTSSGNASSSSDPGPRQPVMKMQRDMSASVKSLIDTLFQQAVKHAGIGEKSQWSDRPVEVASQLVLGGTPDWEPHDPCMQQLRHMKVGAAVNLHEDRQFSNSVYGDDCKEVLDELGEDPNVLAIFKKVCSILEQKRKHSITTYVHCSQRGDRASVCVVAYLVQRQIRLERDKEHEGAETTVTKERRLRILLKVWSDVMKKREHVVITEFVFRMQLVLWVIHFCNGTEAAEDPTFVMCFYEDFARTIVSEVISELSNACQDVRSSLATARRSHEELTADIHRAEAKEKDAFNLSGERKKAKALQIRKFCFQSIKGSCSKIGSKHRAQSWVGPADLFQRICDYCDQRLKELRSLH